MRLSVIVPVYNNARDLVDCLDALRACASPDGEIIVVDDGSTDTSASTAAATNARVLRLERNSGPAAARNEGARCARGEFLFFVDSDVVVARGALERVTRTLEERPDLAAVFGSYDTRPRAAGLVSQYRNLLHHWVHQTGNPDAFTFWAGCGAVRRTAFEAVGGFDVDRSRFAIEDIELGHRLRRAGYRILLDKALQCTHLKRWTLRSMVRADVLYRAVPWTRLMLEVDAMPNDLNLAREQRLSLALVAVAGACAVLALRDVRWLGPVGAALATVAFMNRRLYAFFRRERGLAFALACFPLHLLYYVCGGVGFVYAWLEHLLARRDVAAAGNPG
jgi:GT2 family glycosyltransferase